MSLPVRDLILGDEKQSHVPKAVSEINRSLGAGARTQAELPPVPLTIESEFVALYSIPLSLA